MQTVCIAATKTSGAWSHQPASKPVYVHTVITCLDHEPSQYKQSHTTANRVTRFAVCRFSVSSASDSSPNSHSCWDSMIDTGAGDTQALMAFLQSELQQLEAVAGEEDDEARLLLQQLEQQTSAMQAMSQHAEQQPVLSELQLAQQLDK